MNEITPNNRQKVLLVEPDESCLRLYSTSLREHGYEVQVASTVELAFLTLEYFVPDIVVSADEGTKPPDGQVGENSGYKVKDTANNRLFYRHCIEQKIPFIIMLSEDVAEDGFFR